MLGLYHCVSASLLFDAKEKATNQLIVAGWETDKVYNKHRMHPYKASATYAFYYLLLAKPGPTHMTHLT